MTTFRDSVEFLKSRIRISNPRIDTSPVSVIRVLIDAVAELHAQSNLAMESALDWDITRKSGRDLDNFVSVFGFSRLPGTYAAGYVTITFAANTTRDYMVEEGTKVIAQRPGLRDVIYYVATDVAIPQFSAFAVIPIVASGPGSLFNAPAGELNHIDGITFDSFTQIKNDQPVIGGAELESDDSLRARFRRDIFRNVLGSEAYYRSIAFRHPRVASVQLIKPFSDATEHLKIVGEMAQCQEDSLVYTYPNSLDVYHPKSGTWLEEMKDFTVTLDNETPRAPVLAFTSDATAEGDDVEVRYGYTSVRSRNNPKTGTLHYLDMYVLGKQPAPVVDYAVWPEQNTFGRGSITTDTHPDGTDGKLYHVFTRQPVSRIYPEFDVFGRRYFEGRDYILVKDKSLNRGSTRARDLLLWLDTALPPTPAVPTSFHVPYYAEDVVGTIQEALDTPDVKAATDDILVHAAEEIVFDIDLLVEWEMGVANVEAVRAAIERVFSETQMGSRIRVGPLLREISNVFRVAGVWMQGIKTTQPIRGKTAWSYDVPLLDGTIPILGDLNIQTTAPNLY